MRIGYTRKQQVGGITEENRRLPPGITNLSVQLTGTSVLIHKIRKQS